MEKTEQKILQIADLSVSYGMISALIGVNISIYRGEFVAFIGANGAGKSTLLETVIGIHKPKRGKIFYKGEDTGKLSTERIVSKGVSLCPEGRGILPQMTVMDNLLLGAYHNRKSMKKSLSNVFTIFPILERRQKQLGGILSGGEQQMLSIGRALMAAPSLLMLDEPSLGLAPMIVHNIFEIIAVLSQKEYSIMLSEQNANKALQYAHRAYVFETGRMILEGNSEELLTNDGVIDAYLGE